MPVKLNAHVVGRAAMLLIASVTLEIAPASAATETINTAVTGGRTLNASESLTVTTSGSLTVGGGSGNNSASTVAVTISGNNTAITNSGTIKQIGGARAIRDNTGFTGLVVTNNANALIQTAGDDVIQMNKANSGIRVENYGTLNATSGGQALDLNAITALGSNVVHNYSTGLIQASNADAVRLGVNGVLTNDGTIRSVGTDSGSDGIDAQKNTGISIINANGAASGLIEGIRHGIAGDGIAGTAFTMSVTNNFGGTIRGNNGSGINIDGINANELITIANGGLIQGGSLTGDGDGIDVDGLLNLTNTGTIQSTNAAAGERSEGITAGGGTITNSGLIEGDGTVGRGITLAGIDKDANGNPIPQQGIYANSIINNLSGLIKGQTESAIVVMGPATGFTVTINNASGGTIQGGGTSFAAIRTGADNDTLNNSGIINGSSSGKAIDLGAGNNTLNVTGGSASILGDISGGVGGTNTMTIAAGTGNSFSYSGAISNFNKVEVQSGHITLSGANTYIGATVVTGGTLTLDGANRVSASSALVLNGGTLEIADVSGANGQTFASLSLTASSTIDLDLSSLTFNDLDAVIGGKTLSVIDWSAATSPYYAFRLLGDYSQDADFLALIGATTINGVAAAYLFDGTYTNVVSSVPLPGAALLLVSGLGMLGAMARRRRPGAAA